MLVALRALQRLGYVDAIVRVATPDDPAPDGALVYAIPFGDTCTIGYVEFARPGHEEVLGLLPEGRCLK